MAHLPSSFLLLEVRGKYGRRTGRGARQTQEQRSRWRGPGAASEEALGGPQECSELPVPHQGGRTGSSPPSSGHDRFLAPRAAGRAPGWEVGGVAFSPESRFPPWTQSDRSADTLTKRALPLCPSIGQVAARW